MVPFARSSSLADREAIVPAKYERVRVPSVSQVRSTLLSSSLRAMRERGLLETYRARLPPEHHAAILDSVAGTWLEIASVLEHYRAVDSLGLTTGEAVAMGAAIGEAVHGTVLGTAVRLAKGAGLTPWVALKQCGRLWERLFVGGDVSVEKVGPKEAVLEMLGLPIFRYGYFRASTRGLVQSGLSLFCLKAYATELDVTPTSLAYRLAWA
jgi:hypothetical protein